jgi:hypothetical protein
VDFLDDLPVATITFIAGLVLIIIGYVSDDISFQTAFESVALVGAGSFGIGHVRNGAGRGVRKPR